MVRVRACCIGLGVVFLPWAWAAADVPTPNVGEQAMVARLRRAVDRDPALRRCPARVVIGAGARGAEAFRRPGQSGVVRVLLTWQWLDALAQLAPGTVVVVPEHALDARFDALTRRGVRLLPIVGVLHAKTREALRRQSTAGIDPATRDIVVLAGDVQQEDGSWRMYDRTMLAELLDALPRNRRLLILGAPRTGMHAPRTPAPEPGAPGSGAPGSGADAIAAAVRARGVADWTVVGFRSGAPNLWDAALAFCTRHPGVGLILPGESTSMISEALSLGIRPMVYHHAAMTAASRRFVEAARRQGRVLDLGAGLDRRDHTQTPTPDQVDIVVRALGRLAGEAPPCLAALGPSRVDSRP